MPKDTKTLGNNKARAWESLGFAHKKRLCQHFDTTSFIVVGGRKVAPPCSVCGIKACIIPSWGSPVPGCPYNRCFRCRWYVLSGSRWRGI